MSGQETIKQEKKELNDLQPLLYAFLRGYKEFASAMNEYEQGNVVPVTEENLQESLHNGMATLVEELTGKYDLSLDAFIDLVPSKYKPLARVIKKMPFDQVVDIAADIIKEYGKDEETGKYKSLEHVVTKSLGKRAIRNVLGHLGV